MSSKLPKYFKVTYRAECGEEYEMYGGLFPSILLWCDECEQREQFKATTLEHLSMDWDALEIGITNEEPRDTP